MKNNNDFLWQAVCMESYQCALFLEALQNNKSTTIKIVIKNIYIHILRDDRKKNK